MQRRTNFCNSSRSFRWFTKVVGVFYKSTVTRIQILDIFQSHQYLQHVSHANCSFRRTIQKTPTSLKKVARHINVMMTKVIQAGLQNTDEYSICQPLQSLTASFTTVPGLPFVENLYIHK
jgi:hypothetical protein